MQGGALPFPPRAFTANAREKWGAQGGRRGKTRQTRPRYRRWKPAFRAHGTELWLERQGGGGFSGKGKVGSPKQWFDFNILPLANACNLVLPSHVRASPWRERHA